MNGIDLGNIFKPVEFSDTAIDSMFGLNATAAKKTTVKKPVAKKAVVKKAVAKKTTTAKATTSIDLLQYGKYPWCVAPTSWGTGGKLLNFGVFLGLIGVSLFAAGKILKLGKRGAYEVSEARDRWRQQRSISDIKVPDY